MYGNLKQCEPLNTIWHCSWFSLLVKQIKIKGTITIAIVHVIYFIKISSFFLSLYYLQIWIETAGNWSLAHANGESGWEDGKCGRTSRCFRLFCARSITKRAKGLWQWWFSTFFSLLFFCRHDIIFVVDLNSQIFFLHFCAVSRWFRSCHETWNINDFVLLLVPFFPIKNIMIRRIFFSFNPPVKN